MTPDDRVRILADADAAASGNGQPPGKLTPAQVGAGLKDLGHLRMGIDGRLWRYQGGVYRPDGDAWAAEQVRDLTGDGYRRAYKAEVLDWCRSEQATIGDRPDRSLVNLRNGLLDWRTGELRAHSPEARSLIQLPVDYDPAADCPAVRRFLAQVLPGDALGFAFELTGWLLVPEPRYRKAVLLLGSGHNGKSTTLGLWRALLGAGNVASVTLQAFAEDRFATAELYGKLANLCGDLDARAVRRSDQFKQIVGGVDLVSAQRKYGQPFTFQPYARLVFSANEAPGTADQSDAFFDRWLVVPFPNRFEGAADDRELLGRMTTPAELSGLFNLALAGLRRLDARGRFEAPDSVTEAGRAYREKADTVAGFVEEACVLAETAWVARAELYRAYRSWCEGSGRMPVSAGRFYEHLRGTWKLDETVHRGQRRFLGVGLARHEEAGQ
jgi:putative DNA primase/helicase